MNDYESFTNLYSGLKKSCRNVRWKTSVTQYELNGLKNTAKLMRDLNDGSYHISEYQIFEIFEPKRRTICATRIRDRQFQRSLCDNVLYQELTRHFIYDNCACQIGKGTLFATKRLRTHLQKFYRAHREIDGYYLKCDIHHFFESIRHDVAKEAIDKRVKDVRARQYAHDIIDSFGGDVGIGLGSQVSQLVALAVLDDLDHIIKDRLRVKHYVRYMDDFIIISESVDELKQCLAVICDYLSSVGLRLNGKTSLQPLKHGIKFLHWKYFITKSGKIVMTQTRDRMNRRIRKLRRMSSKCKRDTIKSSVQGMIAHLMHGNCHLHIRNMQKLINSYEVTEVHVNDYIRY